MTRVLLVHGAATTARVWDRLIPLLADVDLVVPDRLSSGDLSVELDALRTAADGAVVVGVSGGATLGLALAGASAHLAGAVLHEPAVGSLAPHLLDHVVTGWTLGGVAGFGSALYGPTWDPSMAPADPGAVERDLAMFRRFEPVAPAPGNGRVLVTVGEDSPDLRHAAAEALHERLGVETVTLPDSGHFVQHDNPAALAAVIQSVLEAI
ncbi:alpha/beta fold hydrolase [Cellulomonas sp. McL0617]|uniref:alpha/beta fold hydrolase n=1 Tax=Cellulomonas sp. McL0617 TaxID=3415675 RepID=UPI003CF5A45B